MATKLFLRHESVDATIATAGAHLGTNNTTILGNAVGWNAVALSTTAGTGAQASSSTATVTGATNGIDLALSSTLVYEWMSLPLAADITISGTITANLWALENNMSANVAINVFIERITPTGAIGSTIWKSANVTELGTAFSANNFTGTPTSTAMTKGDRIRIRVFGDDAGTMATGFTFTLQYNGPTAAAAGDTFVSFTENLTFISAPAGSTLHLTSVAGPAVGANLEQELWTAFGDGVDTAVVNTTAGWTAPIQITNSAGGTAVEWYTRPLTAFTLSGAVLVSVWAHASASGTRVSVRAELATCAGDGSGAVVWAAQTIIDSSSIGVLGAGTDFTGDLTATTANVRGYLAAPDVAVTDGQRLRLRLFIDDSAGAAVSAMVTGRTVTLRYDHTTTGSGDSTITLPQSVTEFVQYVRPAVLTLPSAAVHRAANW